MPANIVSERGSFLEMFLINIQIDALFAQPRNQMFPEKIPCNGSAWSNNFEGTDDWSTPNPQVYLPLLKSPSINPRVLP